MPIEYTPSRRLIDAYLRLRRRLRGENPEADQIKSEVIEAVNDDGTYIVKARAIPASGNVKFASGQRVDVVFKNARPRVIVGHNARRVHFAPEVPGIGEPVVEELFIAIRPDDGIRDVFFRNFDQCEPLDLPSLVPGLNLVSATVKWGMGQNRFFVLASSSLGAGYHIFKFDRENFVPFKTGANAANRVEFERIEILTTNTTVLAVVSIDGSGNPIAPTNFTPSTPGINFVSAALDVDGALIGTFRLTLPVIVSVPGNLPAPNFDSSLSDATTATTFTDTMEWPIIADLTNKVVLLSGYDNPDIFAPFLTLFDHNGVTRITQNIINGQGPIKGFPRAVTWVSSNSFTTTIDPPFEGNTEIVSTWQFGYSTDASGFRCTAEPILVLGKDVPTALRVRGVVAWASYHYNIFLGQTFNIANWHTYFPFSGQTGWTPIAPTAPFPVSDQTGAIAQDPFTLAFVSLFSIARPAVGLSYAPTFNRAVWRKAGISFITADSGLNAGGADSTGFSTLFKTGATAQLTTGLRVRFGQHGLNVLPTDYVYQLDNPSTPLASDAKVKYFVKAWTFRGTVNINFQPDVDKYPEDTKLIKQAVLKDVPDDVTQPTSLGIYTLQVVNDAKSFIGSGEFQTFPKVTP